MNRVSLVSFCLLVAAPLFAQTPSRGVVHVEPSTVAAALAKSGTVATAPGLVVQGSHRTSAGQVEVHDKETDVLYIIEGDATLVTGGEMTGGNRTRPDQWLGTGMIGGNTFHASKGDVFVIPAGVPHWFKEVPSSVSYFVVKVLKP